MNPATSNRGKILWVDDEIDLLKSHILYLEEKGYEVLGVTNGSDGVALVTDQRFDLILLDEMMPGQDGITTLKEIKEQKPEIPVIMITKNEEEWLMDEAISEKIANYLTKPVNPSQIFLACKKILEEENILEEKASSSYVQDFQEIESQLSGELTMDEWWKLYLKLVQWQLEMDKRKDLDLKPILNEQLRKGNHHFVQFIEDNYRTWLQSPLQERPILSHDVLDTFVIPHLANGKKVFFIVIDCFRLDQMLTILPEIRKLYDVDLDYHTSILPTATPFSRNALFSGKTIDQIKRNDPERWDSMKSDETSMNRYEEEFLKKALIKRDLKECSVNYHKITVGREGQQYAKHSKEFMDVSLLSLVVNFVDILTHYRSESAVLREIIPDDSGYRSIVKTWFLNSWLFDVLNIYSQSDHVIILTSDHGSIRVHDCTQVVGDRTTSTGIRYKYGKKLNCSDKHALVIKNPADYCLPEMELGTNYLIAKENAYFVYPTQFNKYKKLLYNSYQHGGISMEEMLVPTITLMAKG